MLTSLQPDTLPPSAPSQPRRGGGSLSGLDRHGLAEWSVRGARLPTCGELRQLQGGGAGTGRPACSVYSLSLLPDWMKKKSFLEPHSF